MRISTWLALGTLLLSGCASNSVLDPHGVGAMDSGISDAATDASDASNLADANDATLPAHPCATNHGGCDSHVTCTETISGAVCGACPSGYSGDSASGCIDINECDTNHGGCDQLVTCHNTDGGFTCGTCPTGYESDGAGGCQDVNECLAMNGGCDPAADCTNTIGSFICGACPSGYTGTGATGCIDINECADNMGGCMQSCHNTGGSFFCSCSTGYALNADGFACDDVNECNTNNGGCDQTCTNGIGTFTCTCGSAYTLNANGFTCDDINECAVNMGGCAQVCNNTNGSFNCGCNLGYALNADTHSCDDVDECMLGTDTCGGLETCTNTIGSFTCAAVRVTQIAMGGYHTCAVLSNGTMKCWGQNAHGQLGYGDTTTRNAPARTAINVGGTVTQIALGQSHTCARLSDGSAKCWGINDDGELGYGDTTERWAPASTAINFTAGTAVQITAGDKDTCALLSNNTVECWGANAHGELGYNDIVPRSAPNGTAISLGSALPVSIEEAAQQTCVLLSDGSVKCWGYGADGANGYGAYGDIRVPRMTSVAIGGNVSALGEIGGGSGLAHCAIFSTMSQTDVVKCWGNNADGQLGDGTMTNAPTPPATTLTALGENVQSVCTGPYHSCALLADNTIECWGDNVDGELGTGSFMSVAAPTGTPISITGTPVAIACGYRSTCALLSDGTAKCWGYNAFGRLGYGDTADRNLPPNAPVR